MNQGKVYLVGGGPGDVGLITLRGKTAIEKADVVIYDNLVNPNLLNFAAEECEKIYVGKQSGQHTLEQKEIIKLLIKKARYGKNVVRLKGGDPYLFGRGGEEAEVLQKKGIAFEVIPGISAAFGASAYAGIPLTHRDYVSTVTFITGHESPIKSTSSIDWATLGKLDGTLVFFMGIKNLSEIVKELLKNGRSSKTPVAIVRWATTTLQKTVVGTLESILKNVEKEKLLPPAIVIVGKVAKFYGRLNWFEKRPLSGCTIVVTRSRAQSSEMVEKLAELGASVIEFPTIKIVPPDNWEPVDKAILNFKKFNWIIFTSVNGVDGFINRLITLGKDIRELGNVKICAIGPATAVKLKTYFLNVDYQPEKYVAEEIIKGFGQIDGIKNKNILLARADIAREKLAIELSNLGCNVTEVVVYKTILDSETSNDIVEYIENGCVDFVTFTSSSTVKNFVQVLSKEVVSANRHKFKTASIGPITSQTLGEFNIVPTVEAEVYTIPGLIDKIVAYYQAIVK